MLVYVKKKKIMLYYYCYWCYSTRATGTNGTNGTNTATATAYAFNNKFILICIVVL